MAELPDPRPVKREEIMRITGRARVRAFDLWRNHRYLSAAEIAEAYRVHVNTLYHNFGPRFFKREARAR